VKILLAESLSIATGPVAETPASAAMGSFCGVTNTRRR